MLLSELLIKFKLCFLQIYIFGLKRYLEHYLTNFVQILRTFYSIPINMVIFHILSKTDFIVYNHWALFIYLEIALLYFSQSKSEAKNMAAAWRKTRHLTSQSTYILHSWEICHRCAKILLAAEHKMQLAYYLRNTDWFQRCSEFGFFDEPFIILFTIFYWYQ